MARLLASGTMTVPRCICFDFDGTLVDSTEAAIHAFEIVGPTFGCPALSRERIQEMRGLHAREILRILGIPLYRAPRFVARMRQAMRAELMETPPVAGMVETLDALARRGRRLGVLSSNAGASVRAYADRHGLAGLAFIVGETGLFGKAAALRRLLRRQGVGPGELLYVGDELRDLEAARGAGVAFAAVGWGYTALEPLIEQAPEYVLRHPADLLDLDSCCLGTPLPPKETPKYSALIERARII